MRLHIIILLFLFVGCKSSININNIEQRDHGLTYIKGTDKLVDGKVVLKLENGKTAELHNFKDGKPIGKWYAYGDNGKVLSHGFGVDAKKYEKKLGDINLTNSFLSINQTGDFTYATFYLDNNKLFDNPNIMVNLSKEIFEEYSVQYKFEDLFLYDKEHEYTISKTAINNNSYKIDTINGKDKRTVFIR